MRSIGDCIVVSSDPPPGWQSLRDLPLVILIGVTGVGKSTLLQSLLNATVPLIVLPDRRLLTDELLIPQVQMDAGLNVEPVTDRLQRFEYTRRYREQYPGGMAHALTQLALSDIDQRLTYLFDGLRGMDEVGFAAAALPTARFVALYARDIIRVQRLLHRQDAFDQTAGITMTGQESDLAPSVTETLPDVIEFFTREEVAAMQSWVETGSVSRSELIAKLQIVISERRNYDPEAAIRLLQQQYASRALILDTEQTGPVKVADRVLSWIRKWRQ